MSRGLGAHESTTIATRVTNAQRETLAEVAAALDTSIGVVMRIALEQFLAELENVPALDVPRATGWFHDECAITHADEAHNARELDLTELV